MKTDSAGPESSAKTVSVSGEELLRLITHRPPMVMIDRLITAGPRFSETVFRVSANGALNDGVCLSEAGLIENMAQTIGAGSGYNRRQDKKRILDGYLTMIKDLKINRLPVSGTEIRTAASFQIEILDYIIFRTESWAGEERIAECEMRIYTLDRSERTI